jgi:tetratricopeptide (TPR) repeat protein
MIKKVLLVSISIFVLTGPSVSGQREKKKPVHSPDVNLMQAEAFFVEGEKYFILEDYTKALLFFQRSVELNPDDAGGHYKVAETLSKSTTKQDLHLAVASMDICLRLDKKNKYYYQLAAGLYANLQNFGKAAAMLETMMKEIPGTEESLFDQAAYFSFGGKPDEALKAYNRAESIFGVNETSSLQKQRILLEGGKINEAIEETEKLIRAFPEEPQYVMAFAEMLNQNNQRTRAIQYLEKFSAENPENGNAKMLLSSLYKDNGQSEKARALLIAVFDDPSVELTGKILAIGELNTEIQQAREKGSPNTSLEELTISLFKKLDATEGHDESVSMLGGDLFLTVKKNKEAKYYYRKAARQGSTSFEPWQHLLVLESQDGEFDSLIAHSDEGLELFPNQAVLYYFSGFGHLRKKHYDVAAQSLEQAKKLSAANAKLQGDINAMLGDVYNATRQYEKSDQAYEDALVLNPENDFVLNNYSYYLSLRKEKLDKAESMASRLAKMFPENATYLDTYGWVLYVREKFKEARKVMEKATSLSQANATHFEHYGDILFRLGDVDGAVRQWEKAKAIDTNNEALNKKIVNRKLN